MHAGPRVSELAPSEPPRALELALDEEALELALDAEALELALDAETAGAAAGGEGRRHGEAWGSRGRGVAGDVGEGRRHGEAWGRVKRWRSGDVLSLIS